MALQNYNFLFLYPVGLFNDFFSLIYPHVCAACGKALYRNENSICTRCAYQLPRTNFHRQADNPVARLFWGRANIHAASSYYRYEKGSKVQQLIHRYKYRGQKEVGITIGKFFGAELKEAESFKGIEAILPVPLHPKKLAVRGYNQTDFFARGLSVPLGAKVVLNNLVRATATGTQTRKSRYERWENVGLVFRMNDPDALAGKHVLLVDDVVTTGATLEGCAQRLLEIPGTRVSIATIAYATR